MPGVSAARAAQALDNGFLADVLDGLSRPRKSLPCKYFYDREGSALFDAICTLDEYYPTRTETALLHDRAAEIAGLAGPGATLVELGSGSSVKVRILLDALDDPAMYVPVDISREHLVAAAARLAGDYPAVTVVPVAADYVRGFALPRGVRPERTVVFFPGSTIGNFRPAEALTFLRGLGQRLGVGARLLIGVDLRKDRRILEAAYNDAAGVTAAFNMNLLARINRELSGTFDLTRFAHRAHYDAVRGRIEMHLESLVPQTVRVAGRPFRFAAGETIHTENSYKYSIGGFRRMAARAGWATERSWTDADGLFSLHWMVWRG
ncbi:L-histidine N(alpha)-methyltransferase [Azospirillum soli]|uniref:L-histidine N(alpha)-methyltransferase n=1 Tax=Azospirillum soli TaxID=1304799 RepID=UPI001AE82A1A|nr:L-histidine N(alpha)-methyltransferase [Azospirillum soli]MBP2310933.1 dimethylhistidine N-methyltransferase [Azospirillum soli]